MVYAERYVHPLYGRGGPAVELRFEEAEQGVCAGVAVSARYEQVHGLVGALLGCHAFKLVGNGYIIGACEIEGHVHFVECACHVQPHVEVDHAVIVVYRDVCADVVHGNYVQDRIHHVAVEGHVAPFLEIEHLLSHYRKRVAHIASADIEASGETLVVHIVLRVAEVSV